jgi:hypothetical protein
VDSADYRLSVRPASKQGEDSNAEASSAGGGDMGRTPGGDAAPR